MVNDLVVEITFPAFLTPAPGEGPIVVYDVGAVVPSARAELKSSQLCQAAWVFQPGRVQGEPRQARPETQYGLQHAQGPELNPGWTRQLPCLHCPGTAGGLHGLLPKVGSLHTVRQPQGWIFPFGLMRLVLEHLFMMPCSPW